MKRNLIKTSLVPVSAAALLLCACQAQAQVPITNIINTFDVAPGSGNEIGMEWGPGTWYWDSTNGNPAGAAHYTASWDPSSDTPLVGFACEVGGNPWYEPNPITVSDYTNLQFDIKWDTNSEITIDEFNDVSTWPYSLTNSRSGGQSVFQSYATGGGSNLVAGGNINGLEVTLCGAGGQAAPTIANINVPAAAATGWAHVNIPINQAQANIDGASGIVFHKWTADTYTLRTNVTASFWIDNVMLTGSAAPPPPPTLSDLQPATDGLNCLATGTGQYDREQVVTASSTGYSFVSQPSVTYSWNIKSFPVGSDNNFQQHFFIVNGAPGPYDQSADWNLADCIFITVQKQTNGTGYLNFRYKTNEPNGNAMFFNGTDGSTGTSYPVAGAPSNPVVSLTASAPVGTWSVTFSDTTNVTITGPGGVSTNFVFDPASAALFADPATLILGGQANNPDGYGKAVVYSQFSASGNASPFTDTFVNDSELDTNLWKNLSNDPNGVNLVPADAAYWLGWSLPDNQFNLESAASLSGPWQSPALPMITVNTQRMVLLSTSDLPGADQGYFRLIKRAYTQLQVLWPGETNAPDTATGVIGTPTPVNANDIVNVTINAVDSTYHIVNVSGDQIIASSGNDANVIWNGDNTNPYTTLSGGTAQGTLVIVAPGSYTLTLEDSSNTNIPPATSSSITVN